MALFAFTTLIGNIYYVDKCVQYILGRESGRFVKICTRLMLAILAFVGAILSADFLWNVADLTMGLMIVINVPVIVFLSRYVFRALKDYEKQKKEGINPVFNVKSINLPYEVDYWN